MGSSFHGPRSMVKDPTARHHPPMALAFMYWTGRPHPLARRQWLQLQMPRHAGHRHSAASGRDICGCCQCIGTFVAAPLCMHCFPAHTSVDPPAVASTSSTCSLYPRYRQKSHITFCAKGSDGSTSGNMQQWWKQTEHGHPHLACRAGGVLMQARVEGECALMAPWPAPRNANLLWRPTDMCLMPYGFHSRARRANGRCQHATGSSRHAWHAVPRTLAGPCCVAPRCGVWCTPQVQKRPCWPRPR